MDNRPQNCRFRLEDEGKPYPRSSCTACGARITTGLGTYCKHTATPMSACPADATIRDWFAVQAPEMPDWWRADESVIEKPPEWADAAYAADWDYLWQAFHVERLTSWRYAFADAMLAARKGE